MKASLIRSFKWFAMLAMLLPLLAACGTDTPPAATAVPAAATNTAPAVAAAPTDTAGAAPAATNTVVAAAGDATATTVPPTPTVQPTVLAAGEGCAASATKLVWYVGLGAGGDADVIPKEKAWADKYNKSQTEACITLQVVHNPESYDTLKAQLAAGAGPDIVGPVGKAGRASFQGSWADVSQLAKDANFDLTKYDPALLDFTKDEGVLVGIPFALFPSFIFYNPALFDEAKLPYPPHKVGEMYNGKEWNQAALDELAQKLTVDAAGNDATAANFDAKNIKQFGYFEQFTDARGIATDFGGGLPYDEANPAAAKIPAYWRAAWKWYYDSVWTKHYAPNADYQNSDLLAKGNPFKSGNVAMAHSHTWYTCCFEIDKMNWDIAVMPTINGKVTAKLHGDTFAILSQSKNQKAAFKVLTAMVVDPDLEQIYGGLPAKAEDRPAFFKAFDARVGSNKIDWTVAEEMLKYPDLPNHESWLPNLIKANDLFGKFRTLMDQTPGLNMDAEVDKLQTQLTEIFSTAPTPTK
ncbi:MAG TPA: sugar ABC transporter substrate-binding protein [Chloroflexia bacterium]|nr:sugar ABC transporter substrate-binding protein [Chloroflexia bacterium]